MPSTSIEPPLFSIVVLSYNNCGLLPHMLASVFAQSYAPIQLVVSDDASPDFDEAALRDFCEKHRPPAMQVAIRANKANRGTVAHLEQALAACRGRYIWLLAADDVIADHTAAARFVAAFEEAGSDTLALCAQVALYNDTLTEQQGVYLSAQQIKLLQEGTALAQFEAFSRECWAPAVGTCYRAEAFDVIGKLSDRYRLVEDWPAYIRLVCAGHPLRGVAATVVSHRAGGISHGAARYASSVRRQYSRDLLQVYQREVRPQLGALPPRARLRARARAVLRWVHHRFWPITFLIDSLRGEQRHHPAEKEGMP